MQFMISSSIGNADIVPYLDALIEPAALAYSNKYCMFQIQVHLLSFPSIQALPAWLQ
jgi:hypothetical protein